MQPWQNQKLPNLCERIKNDFYVADCFPYVIATADIQRYVDHLNNLEKI